MKNYKNLYINGCSFTAGHELDDKYIWPNLLSKELNCNLINQAKNGQSFESIVYNSVNHLCNFKTSETLVIIGITWPERYLVNVENFNFNITPADLGKDKTTWGDKTSTWRRISTPLTTDQYEMDDMHFKLNQENVFKILTSYKKYYETLVKYSTTLEYDQKLKQNYLLIMLQSFLKTHKFNYRFIGFDADDKLFGTQFDIKTRKKFDKSKYIFFDFKHVCEMDGTAHPNNECCERIKNKIIKNLND